MEELFLSYLTYEKVFVKKKCYIATTTHYIDSLCVMNKKIIAIIVFSHNVNSIFNIIMTVVDVIYLI